MEVADGGWRPILAPSASPFAPESIRPRALDAAGLARIVEAFGMAARRARECGYKVLEIHAAHGYLLHEFISPLSNQRSDDYGGPFENRTRLLREVVAAVRKEWPQDFPLFLRISASDWSQGGWALEDSIALGRMVKPLGVDLVDCSSGGAVPQAQIPVGTGYQVPFAAAVRQHGGGMTGAVGMITSPQ